MALIQLNDVTIGFRGPPLLDGVTRQIETGERIGLLGRNGSGKTTLLRILAGVEQPDHGTCETTSGARVALLPQDVPLDLAGTATEVVRQGIPPVGSSSDGEHDDADAWRIPRRIERTLARLGIDGDADVAAMSAGMKRRTLLARAIVGEPDLLLLDEPTNHLDLDSIAVLEEVLGSWSGTLVFVTHDRAFLRRLARRIWELDRGRLFDWSCDYEAFLERKAAALAAEEKQNALFDKKLAQEEVWIRQGVKARRTRNEGRVRALEAMRVARSNRREVVGTTKLEIQQTRRGGDLVVEAEGISFGYGPQMILDDFSTTILRGDKVGVIGPNGAGKTTLLRLLLGQLQPHAGTIKLGTQLDVAYFDQLRGQLDGELTVQQNVAPRSETIVVNGRSRHVIGYLGDFLFSAERARTPVRFLSGGERHRVLLAKLFTQPANVIVLDEPTNDLDAETLEMLEQRLVEFAGTILAVSHDREFLNNVATSIIAFEPTGVRESVGGYDEWLRLRQAEGAAARGGGAAVKSDVAFRNGDAPALPSSPPPGKTPHRRLSFTERHELKKLPGAIESLETQIAELHATVVQPEFYKQPPQEIAAAAGRLKEFETQLAVALARWEELEELAG